MIKSMFWLSCVSKGVQTSGVWSGVHEVRLVRDSVHWQGRGFPGSPPPRFFAVMRDSYSPVLPNAVRLVDAADCRLRIELIDPKASFASISMVFLLMQIAFPVAGRVCHKQLSC